jgi:hypothetical protein
MWIEMEGSMGPNVMEVAVVALVECPVFLHQI